MWKHVFKNGDTARRGTMDSQEGTELLATHERSKDPEGGTQHVLCYVASLPHCKSKGLEDQSLFFSWNVSHWGPDIIESLVILYKISITNTAHLFYFYNCTSLFQLFHLCSFAKMQWFISLVVCFALFQNISMRYGTDFSSEKNWLPRSLPIQTLLTDLQ